MSYAVWLSKTLDGQEHTVAEVGSYTSNVSPMWTAALGENLGDLIERDPVAENLAPTIAAGAAAMRADPARYQEMNPPNGWGNYDGAVGFLDKLLLQCRLHPGATVVVSR